MARDQPILRTLRRGDEAARRSERALVCAKCGYTVYPRISPAVIVLVTKGDKVLLQRNTHYRGVVWSLVAGFVDPGESLEDAIRREVREEASIEVKDIRYFGSQTWPFPSNIMIGFRAEYASGELKPDGEEVVESGWFDREHLPEIPRHGSIARAMLDAWVAESCKGEREEAMRLLGERVRAGEGLARQDKLG